MSNDAATLVRTETSQSVSEVRCFISELAYLLRREFDSTVFHILLYLVPPCIDLRVCNDGDGEGDEANADEHEFKAIYAHKAQAMIIIHML